jgi:DMSO/TMAO reductase YedYZ molybdopterin-dependent catalytic subunit
VLTRSGEHDPREGRARRLPPGQRALDEFPRFGVHLHRPAPAIPDDLEILISGAVREDLALARKALAQLPRTEIVADFHCVAGWSATGLRWGGIPFGPFYKQVIEPALAVEHAAVSHLVFGGLDGWRAVVSIEDALADDVLIADHLNGAPLSSDHGGPLRLVSPRQYGYISVKHLCKIAVHTCKPQNVYTHPAMRLLQPHPRARVWAEERHRLLPAWMLRDFYRRILVRPFMSLCQLGSEARKRRDH